MSPACRMMLFTASPLSINKFKFTVMVFDDAGGMVGTGASFVPGSAAGKLVFGMGVTGATPVTACEGSTAEPPGAAALLSGDDAGGSATCPEGEITSSLPIAGTSELSPDSEVGRVT